MDWSLQAIAHLMIYASSVSQVGFRAMAVFG
jgi:hypothetical protein